MKKNLIAAGVWKYAFSVIILIAGLTPFYINPHASTDHIYGGQIFHTDITQKVMAGYASFFPYILLSIFFILIIKYFIKKKLINVDFLDYIKVCNKNIFLNSIIIFLLSFIFKLSLYNFNLVFSDATEMINNYHNGVIFDVYKLYTLIAVLASKLFLEYNFALSLLNIIFSSLAMSIFLMLLFKASQSFLLNNIVTLVVILYLPLSAMDSLIRTDALYLFLFVLSIYLTLKLTEINNKKSIIYLIIVMFLSCLAREQTIYLLPLFLIFIVTTKINHKKIILISLSFTVVLTSLLISNYNMNKYGMSSLFKNRILVIHAMQYGFLNSNIMNSYDKKLSDDAKILLNDIKHNYIKNILPSKREEFSNTKLPSFWSYIRPDYYNIYDKSNLTRISSKDYFISARAQLVESLKNSKNNLTIVDFDEIIDKSKPDSNYRELLNIQSIIINDFYYDGTSLNEYKNTTECLNISESKMNSECLIEVIKNISYDYYVKRHDIAYYSKAALQVASKYNEENKTYTRHEHINHIDEIIRADPALYAVQSLLSMTSMTGYVPVPSGMSSRFSEVYTKNILPDIFLYDFQKLYYLPVNFWYIYSILLVLFILLFHKEKGTRNTYLFLSLIPIYYGLFLSFATFSEFSRLMLPVIPFIIYNYILLYRKSPIPMSLIIILPHYILGIV